MCVSVCNRPICLCWVLRLGRWVLCSFLHLFFICALFENRLSTAETWIGQELPMSWDLLRPIRSTTARLQLPALPVTGGLRDTTEDRESCVFTNCWVLNVVSDLKAFVMHESVYFSPSSFYSAGSPLTNKKKDEVCYLTEGRRERIGWWAAVLILMLWAFCSQLKIIGMLGWMADTGVFVSASQQDTPLEIYYVKHYLITY